ncbi:hypothetical protein DSO57_1011377 [Entomophthora muscae]|uniref:Uncharacterized protein n=1 Tax=Entomophthora muscae TaxID=34485 RepID=A0ACC2TGX9_9FUNG|nr:hypothetical protein DSO57_1011377 [Entomophthora muscae]
MAVNGVMLQAFEWNIPRDGQHWNFIKSQADYLRDLGVTAVWIPPASKGGAGTYDVGYGIYDAWDLGEFNQQGTVRTKYGTKQELVSATQTLRSKGLDVYADVVFNHRMAADGTEQFRVVEVDFENRLRDTSGVYDIRAWTKFDFPGRNGSYSNFQYNFQHFTGVDYNMDNQRVAIYRILGDNKYWSPEVDYEKGNYDYLLGADVDLRHPDVQKDIEDWSFWMIKTLNLTGFRFDAAKHMDRGFVKSLLGKIRSQADPSFFAVAEYWKNYVPDLDGYVRNLEGATHVFDAPLHYRLHAASTQGNRFDMRYILDDTLVKTDPYHAVTFIDNHDTQPGEALDSWISDWFRPHAHALILLRKDGYPCLFYGDVYGLHRNGVRGPSASYLKPLLAARRFRSWGDQTDYFDHPNTIGWVRHGDDDHPGSGLAVVLTNSDAGWKRMFIGQGFAKQTFYNILAPKGLQPTPNVTIDSDGFGTFHVGGGSVAVYTAA